MKIKTIISAIFTAIMPLAAWATDGGSNITDNPDVMTINITIDGKTLTANLVDNNSAKGLVERLLQGSVTYTANDYYRLDGTPAQGDAKGVLIAKKGNKTAKTIRK